MDIIAVLAKKLTRKEFVALIDLVDEALPGNELEWLCIAFEEKYGEPPDGRAISAGILYKRSGLWEEICRRCDGCGWYEGGATFQTKCEKCKGTGLVTSSAREERTP